jgi:DNA-binding CsgD family transcriptional regulator
MMITQKNGVLIKVREDLESLLKKAKDSNKELIQRVIKHINQDIDTDQDWRQFKIHFDKVHEDFLERLKCQFPDITPKDLQLAAYLRLNLSSKEIASMMNITIRSIEGCRYRLRKHLNLSSETNLSEFIIKF